MTGLAGRSQAFVRWERRSTRGLTYHGELHRVGADYRPELGFLPRTDFTRVAAFAEYYHFPPEGSVLRSHGPGTITYAFFGNTDGRLQTLYSAVWWRYQFPSGATGWIEPIYHVEDVTAPFPLGDSVTVGTGIHRYAEVWFNYQPATGARLRTGADARVGGFYDGWRARVALTPTWNLSRHLELGGAWEYDRIRFPGRGTGLDVHVARLRVGAAVDARLSAVTLLQFNSVTRRAGLNVRLRYNFGEGSDLWLVWDEGVNTDRDGGGALPGTPRPPFSDTRALLLKLTHTLVAGG